jgi:TRAP-type C4-dicarboxylate transport system substrate-binding protein
MRIWVWDLDEVSRASMSAMGLRVVPQPLWGASKAYDDGRTDGFSAIPVAALAFQWTTQARYFADLRTAYLVGCMVIAQRAWDILPIEHQRILRAAIGKGIARMDDLEHQQDDELLGGLFERQGLRAVPVSQTFRSEFFAAARQARERLEGRIVPAALLSQVAMWLADYRGEHPTQKE